MAPLHSSFSGSEKSTMPNSPVMPQSGLSMVTVPLSAATFAFTVSLGEFGATLLITRPEYPTIPIAISRFLSQPGGLNYGQAMAMATVLMLLTTLSILLIEKLRFNNAGEL